MATIAGSPRSTVGDEGFFLRGAIAMALVIVAGFSFQLAMGRSTFASPPLVHAHAIVFMGWIAIYVTQNILVATDRISLHRRLGWVAAGWIVLMIGLGIAVTVAMARRGQVPFFFRPLHFLVFDPVALFTFAGLTAAAIMMRRRTEWHRRLHFCGTAMLMGPGFGRLLPMPLIVPYAYEATFAAVMIFPVVGALSDVRRSGRVHPAWKWGMVAMVGSLVLTEALTYSPLGTDLYRAVTAGSPGASVAPLDFPPPPTGPLMTGRGGN
jgi:hypothetical protein